MLPLVWYIGQDSTADPMKTNTTNVWVTHRNKGLFFTYISFLLQVAEVSAIYLHHPQTRIQADKAYIPWDIINDYFRSRKDLLKYSYLLKLPLGSCKSRLYSHCIARATMWSNLMSVGQGCIILAQPGNRYWLKVVLSIAQHKQWQWLWLR